VSSTSPSLLVATYGVAREFTREVVHALGVEDEKVVQRWILDLLTHQL